ncbi:MAG: hypothetical protein Q8O89_00575, partial [Nanoarchaeota archaeon]|nr:hypothetical protein [Nanoarchaeota archaeon]
MKTEKPIVLNGIGWTITVTRNMSFWHQYLSNEGHFHNTKDFGIKARLEVLTLTVDGTEATAFINQPNLKKYVRALMDVVNSKSGITRLKQKYQKYAEEILISLEKLKLHLTLNNWKKFLNNYKRFCAGLQITTMIGRAGGEMLAKNVKDAGFRVQEIPEIIASITYPNEHTPLFNSRMDLLTIGKKIQDKKLDDKKIYGDLKKWLLKYQHIPVNFCEEPWTLSDVKQQLNDILRKNCSRELAALKISHNNRIKKAKNLLKKIDNNKIAILALAISEGTYLNEFRKNIFSKVSLEYREVFKKIAEIGSSNNWRDCFYLTPNEMTDIIN